MSRMNLVLEGGLKGTYRNANVHTEGERDADISISKLWILCNVQGAYLGFHLMLLVVPLSCLFSRAVKPFADRSSDGK